MMSAKTLSASASLKHPPNLRLIHSLVSRALVISGALWCAASLAEASPFNIHLTWDQQDGSDTTIVIAWATADSGSTAVQYGLTDSYGSEVTGSSFYSSACEQYINEAILSELTPDTTYHYRCGSPGNWSDDHTFRTGLEKGSSDAFSFVVYGDSQINDTEAEMVADAVWSTGPAFVLHNGDFVMIGEDQLQWDRWFSVVDTLTPNCVHMGSIGNHDLKIDGAGLNNYLDQFALPHTEMYYSFDYGNAHFICLYLPYDESEIPDTSAQYQWLVNDLASAQSDPDILWRFAWWHVPPYSACANNWAHNTTVIDQLYPLLQQYDVQVVFQGHCHNYERTYMLRDDQIAQYGPLFVDPQGGVINIVTGGAGASLYNSGTEWWTAYSESCYHFCRVTIDNNWLTLEAVYDDGVTTFDSFSIMLQEEFADLRAFWRFEEGEGSTVGDHSDYANNGTVTGASWTETWERGRALAFDGVDDCVHIANSPSLANPAEEISLVAWIKTPGGGDHHHTVIEKWFYDEASVYPIHDRSFRLSVHPSGEVQFDLSSNGSSDSSVSLVSAGTVDLGGWTHIAATCDGDTMRIYIDGLPDPNTSYFAARIHPSGAGLHIGRLYAINSVGEEWHDPFDGAVDELRVYSRALSPSEILEDAEPWSVWASRESGDLTISWSPAPSADSVFVFRDTTPYFEPDVEGNTNRVASLPASDGSYGDSYGIGDPWNNAFYRLVAYSNAFGNIRYSLGLGEFDRRI
jgi:hypothetical protein